MNKLYTSFVFPCVLLLFFLKAATAQINISLMGTPPICGGFSTGSIYANVTGGQPPYLFEWSNGQQGNPITGLPVGQYYLTVTDAAGNTATDSIELVAPPPLEVQISVTECSPPGAMVALPSGGTPPYSILWNTGDTTAEISGLPIGQYCIVLVDANNCAFINCQYIGEPLSASIHTTSAECNNPYGGGTATVFVEGGVAPFDYTWSNGMSGPILDSLPAGPIAVTVTAYNGCSAEASDTIDLEESPLEVNIYIDEPNCPGDSTGWVLAEAPGAYLPITFHWNTGDSSAEISNLPAGDYYVAIQDAMGCEVTKSFQLDHESHLSLSLEAHQPTCYGSNNGSIKANPSDGLPPYVYKWNTGDSTQSIENLPAGTYVTTVTDVAGCTKVDSTSLTYPPSIEISLHVKNASHCAAKDGRITPVLSGGGSWPYKFEWSDGTTDSILQNAAAGWYSVTITSHEGCQVIDSAYVGQPTTLTVNVTGTSLVCEDEQNGMLQANVQYGTSPYQYLWSNGATTPVINNLGPGVYSVTVTSSEGCKGNASKTIFSSPEIGFNVEVDSISCQGANDGHLGIIPVSGLAPFNIHWSTGESGAHLHGLEGGWYGVTITDIAGCTASHSFILNEPPALEASILSSAGTCGNQGTMQTIVAGGTAPYTYSWSTGQTTSSITSSQGGIFTVTVTDSHECQAVASVSLVDAPGVTIDVSGIGTSCYGKADGMLTVEVSTGTPPFQFAWSNGANNSSLDNLPAGLYTVTVTDLMGCTQTASHYIPNGPPLLFDIVAPQYGCVGQPFSASVVPSNSAAQPLSFQWSNGQQTQTAIGLESGSYTVTMTDGNGCMGIDSISILEGGNFSVEINKADVSCFGKNDGEISLNIQGGIWPLVVHWNTGDSVLNLIHLQPGEYSATITETTSGCSTTASTVIDSPTQLNIDLEGLDGLCGQPATAIATVSGGTQPWSFYWNNGDTSSEMVTTISGLYILQVTDANNCISRDSIFLQVAPSPTAEIIMINYPTSPQLPDGSLTVNFSNLAFPVNIVWSNSASGDTISGLAPGVYSVTLTDANNCEVVHQFEIPIFGAVGDFAWLDQNANGIQEPGELGLDSVVILVSGNNFQGDLYTNTISTNNGGNYTLYVPPGEYTLNFQLLSGFSFTTPHVGGNDELDSDIEPSSGQTQPISVVAGEFRNDIDVGFITVDTCNNVTEPGKICCDTTVCLHDGNSVQITESEIPQGGFGELVFQWFWSSIDQDFDPNNWMLIVGASSPTIEIAPTETGYFVRAVHREGCSEWLASNKVRVEVQKIETPTIIGPGAICQDISYSFEIEDPDSLANYEWTFSQTANVSFAGSSANPIVSWTGTQNTWLSLGTSVGTCVRFDTLFLENAGVCAEEDLLLHGKNILEDAILYWKWPLDSTSGIEFVLEWAPPGDAFHVVSTRDSAYTSNDSLIYLRIHPSPPSGKNYYRLRLSDTLGEKYLSNVVELNFKSQGNLVVAYPNPFRDLLFLEVIDDYDSTVSYTLIDALGRKWERGVFEKEEFVKSIDSAALPSGLYLLMIEYDGALVKVIKLLRL